jgi:hypothetical protein
MAGTTPFYDQSRMSDLKKMEAKAQDPNTSQAELRKIEETKYAFRDQAQFESVQKSRDKLIEATQRGDAAAVATYSDKLARADRDLGVYYSRH